MLFSEFEFRPTPETVQIAFGINEDPLSHAMLRCSRCRRQEDPIKEWGDDAADNKPRYGGSSAINLAKPAHQKALRFVCAVGCLAPGALGTLCGAGPGTGPATHL